ncbi:MULTISPECIES: hypothetical protein [unclassified Microcoleus]|uniref:hypothetical protein n=1 Tax=unclassified Microcoleus TaxID=2642155 RepID=UPI002FD35450
MPEDSERQNEKLTLIMLVHGASIGVAMSFFISPGIVGTIVSDLKQVLRSESQC